jgi:hypothetical protein
MDSCYAGPFMDPIIQDLLKEGGKTVLATTLTLCMTKLLRRRKKEAVTPLEKKQIESAAEKMIQAASMEDVRHFSPAYQRIAGAAKKGSAAKKVSRKVTIKCGSVKATPQKRVPEKRAITKKR